MDLTDMDLSTAPADVLVLIMSSMSIRESFTCALVCQDWAKAAAAATHAIVTLTGASPDTGPMRVPRISGLQQWLERHGGELEVLQLQECRFKGTFSALPCPQLRQLQLSQQPELPGKPLRVQGRVWSDLAAATKLTSVALDNMHTASQGEVVSALTALSDLKQLSWQSCLCRCQTNEAGAKRLRKLSDSDLVQQLTQLTSLELHDVTNEVLLHLGCLTKLQHLSLSAPPEWVQDKCPGLQHLIALTRLELGGEFRYDVPDSVSCLAALQQLDVGVATTAALNRLQVLSSLTQLEVKDILFPDSAPLQLPALQHLELSAGDSPPMAHYDSDAEPDDDAEPGRPLHMSRLTPCTQLRVLRLRGLRLLGPVSLVGSCAVLQRLELKDSYPPCQRSSAQLSDEGSAQPSDEGWWCPFFPASAQLPQLTSLRMAYDTDNVLDAADVESVVACCTGLQALEIGQTTGAHVLGRLPNLTSLHVKFDEGDDPDGRQCSTLAQLTGLRELGIQCAQGVGSCGLRHLAALEQLTSLGFNNLNDWGRAHTALQSQLSDKLRGFEHALCNKVRLTLQGTFHGANKACMA